MSDEGREAGLAARGAMACIRFYQRIISPLFPARCIYMPTCSEYALQAVRKHGFIRGGVLAIKRILRCHPLHEGGYDPVP